MSRKRTAKLLLYIVAAFLLSFSFAYADDTPLTITTTSFPRGLAGTEFHAQLEASGGSGEGYVFYISRGRIQDGLSLAEDGTISGTPTASGAYSVYFGVRDSENHTATKRLYVRISGKTVNFTVTDDRFEYDGAPHTATLTPSLSEIEEGDFEVFYGGQEAQTDVGSYYIRVVMRKPGYLTGNVYPQLLTIGRSTACELSLESAVYEYDGQVRALTPVVTPAELTPDVTVEYEGVDGTDYPRTTQAPSGAGRYRVTATQTNPNYVALVRTATLTITAPRIDFEVSGTEFDYNGLPHQATVTPLSDGAEVPEYTVTYDDLSTADTVETLTEVTDAGTYQINIVFTGGNYAVGEINETIVTVHPQIVDFTVTDTRFEYDGEPHQVTVTPVSGGTALAASEYTVTYDNMATEEVEALSAMTDAGSYRIRIASENRNYSVGVLSAETAVITSKVVSFTVTDAVHVYDGQPHRAAVEAVWDNDGTSGETSSTCPEFTVTYDNLATPETEADSAVTEIGRYAIHAAFADSNYTAAEIADRLTISPRAIDFTVTDTEFDYNGELHQATVTPVLSGSDTAPEFTATYDDLSTEETEALEGVIDAGAYRVNIAVADPTYVVGTIENGTVTVRPKQVAFTAEGTTHVYDGRPHTAEVKPVFGGSGSGGDGSTSETIPSYTVTYDNVATEQVETLAGATEVGTYAIHVTFENKNYMAVDPDQQLIISPRPIDFRVEEEAFDYDGTKHQVQVTALLPAGETVPEFTLTYDDLSTEGDDALDGVTDAGSYQVKIAFTDSTYTVGTIENDVVAVNPKRVDFTVTDALYVYDGEMHQATLTPLWEAAGIVVGEGEEPPVYTVSYDNLATEETETELEVAAIGRYAIAVSFEDRNYAAGTLSTEHLVIEHKKLTFKIENASCIYDGEPHQAAVTPVLAEGEPEPEYTVTYDDLATEETETLAEVIDAGVYRIDIALADGTYAPESESEMLFVVQPRPIRFAISNFEYVYDGETHRADIEPLWDESGVVIGDGEEPPVYTVTYDDAATEETETASEVSAIGTYEIRIAFTNENYMADEIAEQFVISHRMVNFTIEDTEYVYNGEARSATVTPVVTTEQAMSVPEYTVTYDDAATDDTEAYRAVTNAGTYHINIIFADETYAAAITSGSALLTVTPKEVTVAISGELVKMDEQAPPYAAVATPDDPDFREYVVTYRGEDGATYTDSVSKAGVYDVEVASTSRNYTATATGSAIFTVEEGVKVHFMITDNRAVWKEGTESYGATVTPCVDGFDGYEVLYYAQGGSGSGEAAGGAVGVAEVTSPGVYRIEITITDETRQLGDVIGDQTFTLVSLISSFTLGEGNSLAVRIAEEDGRSALDEFKKSYLYEDVYYSPEAWEDKNLDLDETAYFITPEVFRGGNLGELLCGLSYTATRSDGTDGTADVMVTIDGEEIDAWRPTETGVYDMMYSYDGESEGQQVAVTRKIVLLTAEAGDVNGDRNLNAGDANYLRKRILSNEELLAAPGASERLLLYRVCDADHDGTVSDADAEAILNRMKVSIARFYQ